MKRGKPGTAATETCYVETSALLAALLEDDIDARQAIRGAVRRITSALTLTEANRAVVRARAANRIDENGERAAIRGLRIFAQRCTIVAISDEVLTRAGRIFPVEPVRTLDAIHIATAELLGEPPQLITFVTRDKRIAANARALGYSVLPEF